jgi:hypothetical protein
MRVETVEIFVPEPLVEGEPIAGFSYCRRVELAPAMLTVGNADD